MAVAKAAADAFSQGAKQVGGLLLMQAVEFCACDAQGCLGACRPAWFSHPIRQVMLPATTESDLPERLAFDERLLGDRRPAAAMVSGPAG